MGKFIELRFGQGDLCKSITGRKDVKEGEYFVQWVLVPVEAIKAAYVILPEKRNIRITFEGKNGLTTLTEYYKNTVQCIKRWCMIRKAMGISANDVTRNPVALPMDAEEWEKIKEGQNNE